MKTLRDLNLNIGFNKVGRKLMLVLISLNTRKINHRITHMHVLSWTHLHYLFIGLYVFKRKAFPS